MTSNKGDPPIIGCLEDTVQVAPGVDLVEPADPEWADLADRHEFAMTFVGFKNSLMAAKPLAGLAPALVALWWAAKDDWGKAHRLVMDEGGKDCAWVHAYLHRVEGDLDNARYWYKEAGKPAESGPLSAEWEAIARVLLDE